MSSPLSRASSRWLIISLCRKSSTGIVALLPVLVARLLYGPTDMPQEDFPTAKATRGTLPGTPIGDGCSRWLRCIGIVPADGHTESDRKLSIELVRIPTAGTTQRMRALQNSTFLAGRYAVGTCHCAR